MANTLSLEDAWQKFLNNVQTDLEKGGFPPFEGPAVVMMKAGFFNGAAAAKDLIARGRSSRMDHDLNNADELLHDSLKIEKARVS